MEKNYYHLQLNPSEKVSIKTPSEKGRIEQKLLDDNIVRYIFSNGEEMLHVATKDRLDIYASFPLEVM